LARGSGKADKLSADGSPFLTGWGSELWLMAMDATFVLSEISFKIDLHLCVNCAEKT
jgi:hypothetical protein